MTEKEKEKKSILKKLYSVAEPIIRYMPGRDIEEKRLLFNTMLVLGIMIIYTSPLPAYAIKNVCTLHGIILTVMLIFLLPYFAIKYIIDVSRYYTKRYLEYRKPLKKDAKT